MIQSEKLAQFYFMQYRDCAKEMKKKNQDGKKDFVERMNRLHKELKECKNPKISQAHLDEYHRMVRSMAFYTFRTDNQYAIMKLRDMILPELVRIDLLGMKPEEQELVTAKFLDFIREEHPYEICQKSLRNLARNSAENGIRSQIIGMVPTKPETEFPKALEMQRHFILHVGPTNCGKTYHALESLKQAMNGVYLGPLRLLALEVYEKMNDAGIPCTMLTGEERIYQENAFITSSTIEMLDIEQEYDVAVIDEAQMITDPDRGHSWTRAILGVQAKEIHVCMSPAAEKVVKHLISLCGDTEETHVYERKTKLLCEDKPFEFPDDVQEGDAIIAFSKRAVLDIAGRLETDGIKASVIYGSLPPEIRRRQIHLFTTHQTKVVVSTDAIGMGLNLPVRRIVFAQTTKFDGKETGPLTVETIHQIAGRAGRFGIYDTGYVTAVGKENLDFIREKFPQKEKEVESVSLGFPQVLLDMDEPLDAVLKIWKSVETQPPFEKISIEEVLFLYERAYKDRKEIDGFEDKHLLYRMLTCSIDIKNRDIVELWLYYCKTYTADVSLHFPALIMCTDIGLHKYETFYKLLDLYYQFSIRMGKVIEQERLDKEREKTEETIMRLLSKDKNVFIRKCQYCGAPIELSSTSRMCDNCYAEMKARKGFGEGGFGRKKMGYFHASEKEDKHPSGKGNKSHRRYNRHRGESNF